MLYHFIFSLFYVCLDINRSMVVVFQEAEKERQKEKDRQLAWEAEHKKFTKRVAKSAKRR